MCRHPLRVHKKPWDFPYSFYKYSETAHLPDLPECPLNRGCMLYRGLITINFQWLLRSVIKFHVFQEAKEAVLYFVQDVRSYLQFIDS